MITVYILPVKEGMISIKVDNRTKSMIRDIDISGLDHSGMELLPLGFPENEKLINIYTDINQDKPFDISIIFEDSTVMSIPLEISDKKVDFRNFRHSGESIDKSDEDIMDRRRQIACELFSSDEGFISELMDISDNPEHDLAEGEELATVVAENTLYIKDEDDALKYINWKVVKSPDSVQNTILAKYE